MKDFFRQIPPKLRLATAIVLGVWLLCVIDAVTTNWLGSGVLFGLRLLGLASAVPLCVIWIRWSRNSQPLLVQRAIQCACFILCWPLPVYLADGLGLPGVRASFAQLGMAGLFAIGLGWVIWYVEDVSQRLIERRRAEGIEVVPPTAEEIPSRIPATLVTAVLGPIWLYCCWKYWAWYKLGLLESEASWQAWVRLIVLCGPPIAIAAVWARWAWRYPGIRNPLDLEAWYYGRRSQKLSQSLGTMFSYSLAFLLAVMLFNQLSGCQEIYELPAGGGEQKTMAQSLKIQKVIKKKFVINPFSAIIFNPPPIDEVKLQLLEVTQHQYTVGYGAGAGAGFAGGTKQGKVRFIRLEYAGGDWNQDFGVGGDLNLLVEYGARTAQSVSNQTESRTVAQLNNFPIGKSPPFVYMTGQRNIQLSKNEAKILREYLTDKHGMLFGDNGGGWHFHNQFFAMMQQVLPNVEPVRIPLDDVVHRIPYQIPFLPYVSPHGGKDAWGWKIDGRWVCYYHPGDIGDAWTDDHAGVEPDTYEYCYQLGTNVIFYAHVEYSKWLSARQPK